MCEAPGGSLGSEKSSRTTRRNANLLEVRTITAKPRKTARFQTMSQSTRNTTWTMSPAATNRNPSETAIDKLQCVSATHKTNKICSRLSPCVSCPELHWSGLLPTGCWLLCRSSLSVRTKLSMAQSECSAVYARVQCGGPQSYALDIRNQLFWIITWSFSNSFCCSSCNSASSCAQQIAQGISAATRTNRFFVNCLRQGCFVFGFASGFAFSDVRCLFRHSPVSPRYIFRD